MHIINKFVNFSKSRDVYPVLNDLLQKTNMKEKMAFGMKYALYVLCALKISAQQWCSG